LINACTQMPCETEHALMAEDCAPDMQQASMASLLKYAPSVNGGAFVWVNYLVRYKLNFYMVMNYIVMNTLL
jgi:hypothetical protein